MGLNAFSVFGLIVVIAAVTSAKSTGTNADPPTGALLPGYDCSGMIDGDYRHPSKCTHFVKCVGETIAYEMQCALGHDGQPLHWVVNSGPNTNTSHCDYPAVAGCTANGNESTTANPDVPTSEAPAPTTTTTLAPTPAPGGNECNPFDCKKEGICQSFRVCENGTWADETCRNDTFWNPSKLQCDHFSLLPEPIKQDYRSDRNCIPPCEWFTKEVCSPNYWFREPFNNKTLEHREHQLQCSADPDGITNRDLIFNPDTRDCDLRENVKGCNGP